MASYSHRTAQLNILAVFLPWGSSRGAGRIRLAAAKVSLQASYSKIIANEILFFTNNLRKRWIVKSITNSNS
jgi:hypothetical protein